MKVPALRIEVNGEFVAIAGAPDLSMLSGQVAFGATGPNDGFVPTPGTMVDASAGTVSVPPQRYQVSTGNKLIFY